MQINESFQDFIFDYTTKFYILKGGAGSSKSYSIAQKLIIKGLKSPRKILCMRATQVSLRDSCIALFKSILEKEGIPYTYRSLAGEIQFGESVILFKGGDNPERLKSIVDITDIFLEEATEMSPDMFTQLVLRLRTMVDSLQFIIAFNPVSKLNWVYRYFFDTSSSEYFLDGRDFKIHESTYKDNSFLPDSYISDLLSLRKSNPYYFTVYAEGEWGTLGKLIFPYGTYKIEKIQVPLGTPHVWGCDPGVVDKFAIEGSALLPNNTLYTYKEFCASNVLNKDVAKWIKEHVPSACTIYTDNAGASQIQELQALGCYNVVKNDKPAGSIITTIDKIKTFNWVISPECEHLLKDLTLYQWDKDKSTGLYKQEPAREVDGYHCDAVDAVRYSTQGIGARITSPKISLPRGL